MYLSFIFTAILCVFLKNQSNTDLVTPRESGSTKLSITHINLGNAEDVYDLIGVLNRNNADVISFQELTPDWSTQLTSVIEKTHPYKFEEIRIDPYGKAIFSKYPIRGVDTISYGNHRDYSLKVQVGSELFQLVTTYLVPALNSSAIVKAQNQLNQISKYVNNNNTCLIFGEFNMVYWDEEIITFRNNNELLNSRKDIQPTSLKVPFDHIFYSKNLNCILFEEIASTSGIKYGSSGVYQVKQIEDTKHSKVN